MGKKKNPNAKFAFTPDPAYAEAQAHAEELPDLDFSHIDAEHSPEAMDLGPMPEVTEADVDSIEQIAKDQKKFGNRPGAEFAHAALGTATFSLSDRFLDKTGLMSKEDQLKLAEQNPGAETAGTVAGVVAPALITLGASTPESAAAAAARGGTKALATLGEHALPAAIEAAVEAAPAVEKLTAGQIAKGVGKAVSAPVQGSIAAGNAAEKVVANLIKDKIKREVVRKSLAKATGGAVEGALLSTGQLAREDALGTRDFNAENLLDAAGTGALYGGLVGAAIPVVGEAFSGAGRQGKKIFDKVISKYGDPVEDARILTGLTTSESAKLYGNKAGKEMLEDLPRWYKEEAGLHVTDSAEDILGKVEKVKTRAAQNLNTLIDQVDAEAKVKIPDVRTRMILRRQVYLSAAREMEDELIKPYSRMHSFQSSIRKAREIVADFRNLAMSRKPLEAVELRDLRIKMDELAKKFYKSADPSMADEAAFKARDLLKKAINTYADYVNPELAAQIEKANKNYFTASKLEKSLNRKSLSGDPYLHFKDLLYGTVGYSVGHGAGLGLAFARKALNSDLKRKLVILGGIEKANGLVTQKISQAIGDFVTASKTYSKNARPASVSVLVHSGLAQKRAEGQKPEAPKTKAQAFTNLKTNLASLQADPKILLDHVARATAPISSTAPETATAMGEGLTRGVQFLASKVPKDPSEGLYMGRKHEYQPSSMELAKFERYLQVVEQPTSVLDDLKNGTLTREHVEALEAVYPNMYNRFRTEVLTQVREDSNMSYGKRVQLGLLLGIPTDPSMTPLSVLQLQQGFATEAQAAQEQGAVNPTVGGTKEIDQASRVSSDADAFLERRQEG